MNQLSISSGRQDSNLRPPGPKPGALTGLRYAPPYRFKLPCSELDGKFSAFDENPMDLRDIF